MKDNIISEYYIADSVERYAYDYEIHRINEELSYYKDLLFNLEGKLDELISEEESVKKEIFSLERDIIARELELEFYEG